MSARPAGDQPSIDDAYAIADFGRWCESSWFPIPASDLCEQLDAAGAPAWIVARVAELEPGTVVESPRDAWLRSRT